MQVQVIDIREILKTQHASFMKKAKAENYLEENCINVSEQKLYVFDLTTTSPDHYFCQAFGKMYDISLSDSVNSDVLFKIHDYQIDELLKGILESKNINYSNRGKDVREIFIESGLSIKYWLSGKQSIEYLSNIDEDSNKIIKYINDKCEAQISELIDSKVIDRVETMVNMLQELVRKRFVYTFEASKYISVCNLIDVKP